ncbi:FACT complex subunit spt16-like [Ochlerotatus camptorhynchus]|uniref:FACT complex subunit spt16-like n=1 Tax=Ochlerotatus camptorhynchus TaxID=644619 RepID=UPI0031DCBD96
MIVADLRGLRGYHHQTVDLFNKYLKDHVVEIMDADKKVKHAKLSKGVELVLTDKRYVSGVDTNKLDMCYPAIIQSGGNYSLKFSAFSDKNYLHFGSIICAVGARYKSNYSNVVRTLLVNPTETIQKHYTLLLNLEEELLKVMIPVKKLSEVFDVEMVYAKKKDLKQRRLVLPTGWSSGRIRS